MIWKCFNSRPTHNWSGLAHPKLESWRRAFWCYRPYIGGWPTVLFSQNMSCFHILSWLFLIKWWKYAGFQKTAGKDQLYIKYRWGNKEGEEEKQDKEEEN